MHKQLEQLNDGLAKINSTIPSINYGGCGVFAGLLGEQLQIYTDCLIKIAVCDYDSDAETVWYRKTFHHVWLELKFNNRWYSIDSDGIIKGNKGINWMKPHKVRFNVDHIIKLAVNRSKGWSTIFDRKQIPKLAGLIEQEVKQIFS